MSDPGELAPCPGQDGGQAAGITVREETPADAALVSDVVRRAYAAVPFSNHREHLMVERLRASSAFVPPLSLVAEVRGEPAGHIMLTRITIRDGAVSTPSLALAPLSVVPEFQGRSVGSALVHEAHRRARALGFRSVVVVGIAGYYGRFGYVPLGLYPVTVPFEVRPENCGIHALCEGGLDGLRGVIEYAPEWMEAPR